ncbi:hypothetical protein [Croceicoccus mobilis]|uniref:Uncharacterized protein n=1 Tax=Croceicoccus mobilis TaxID=1703339 RepID=A0A916ZAF2_9SPHN|nr:hypothetical protein [Croceicoccus mobilis]GGD82911.1 hypothetical protein GCM10010990_36190 [Croceicoccus mobilis]
MRFIEINIDPDGILPGAYMVGSGEYDEKAEVGRVFYDVQVFSKDFGEYQARIEVEYKFDIRPAFMLHVSSQAAGYAACVFANIAKDVLNDLFECKQKADAASPKGPRSKIWSDTLACLGQKSAGHRAKLLAAITTCGIMLGLN